MPYTFHAPSTLHRTGAVHLVDTLLRKDITQGLAKLHAFASHLGFLNFKDMLLVGVVLQIEFMVYMSCTDRR